MNKRYNGIIDSAAAKILAVVYIAILIVGISRFMIRFYLTDCLFELIFAVAVPALVVLYVRKSRHPSFPMTIAGQEVHPNNTRKARLGRITAYVFDSLQYTVVICGMITLIDFFSSLFSGGMQNFGITPFFKAIGGLFLQAIGFFCAYFVIDFLMYEIKADKYLKHQTMIEQRKEEYKALLDTEEEIPASDGEQNV